VCPVQALTILELKEKENQYNNEKLKHEKSCKKKTNKHEKISETKKTAKINTDCAT